MRSADVSIAPGYAHCGFDASREVKRSRRSGVLAAAVLGVLGAASPAAQSQEQDQELENIIVTGKIIFRDRIETVPPVLTYGREFFERFEPLTVGDMMKRVPSVTFLSDVLEFDAIRLRGLEPGYSQVLINGRKTPGSEADRSFFVDRIPAELIDRIEIVRSASADRSGEGIGGSLNIVLKGHQDLEGGYLRAGGLYFDDDELKGSLGGVYGGKLGEWRYTLGADVQERYNPKSKVTNFYDADRVFAEERELESDTRDGTDYSFSATAAGPVGEAAQVFLSAFYTQTDRDEREDVTILEGSPLAPDAIEAQDEDIQQDNLSLEAGVTLPWSAGETEVRVTYATFTDDIVSTEFEADPGDALEPTEREINDSTDDEIGLTVAHTLELGGGKLKAGLDYLDKQRDTSIRVFEFDDGALDEDTPPNGVYTIDEQRLDPFVKYDYSFSDNTALEAGLRYEMTEVDVDGDAGKDDNDYDAVLPSLHVKHTLGNGAGRVYGSLARTVRRPNFDLIAPYEIEEEPAEEDALIGNPQLDPELAWGLDVGYELPLGDRGIAGINVFYRDIEDVIEFVSTGVPTDAGGLVFTADNVGSGETWGVELDLSTPLSVLELDNTGVFLNAAWLDSSIDDRILGGDRKFQNQPDYVFNVGFIQNLPKWQAAFGVNYRQQGDAEQIVLGEIRETSYDGDFEVFVEKRWGRTWVLRFTAANLLDLEKEEVIFSYDGDSTQAIVDAMRANDIDEIEIERESSGPVLQLALRAQF
jgi:outer membrane receptor protein involved in Fe transport